MPHDAKGQQLRPGDTVTMKLTVMDVSQGEKDCNVTLQSVDETGAAGPYRPIVSCNSKLVEKA